MPHHNKKTTHTAKQFTPKARGLLSRKDDWDLGKLKVLGEAVGGQKDSPKIPKEYVGSLVENHRHTAFTGVQNELFFIWGVFHSWVFGQVGFPVSLKSPRLKSGAKLVKANGFEPPSCKQELGGKYEGQQLRSATVGKFPQITSNKGHRY